MPNLGETGTDKITLKRLTEIVGEECWVKVKKYFLVGDIEDLGEPLPKEATNKQKLARLREECARLIVDWNLMKDGKTADITAEALLLIPIDDLTLIQNENNLRKQAEEVKKNSLPNNLSSSSETKGKVAQPL